MSEKISLVIDASVNGVEEITATTTATERLTAALEEQRGELKSLKQKMGDMQGIEKAKEQMGKLGIRLNSTKEKYTGLAQKIKEHNVQTRSLGVEYRKAEREVSGLKKQMQAAGTEGAESLAKQLKKTETKMRSLNDEIAEGKQTANEFRTEYQSVGKQIKELTKRKGKQISKARSLRSELRAAGISTRNLGDEQKRLESLTEKTNTRLEKQNKRLKEMKGIRARMDNRSAKMSDLRGSAMTTAVAAAPLAASLWASVKNESSFANVKKVVDMDPGEAEELRHWSLKQSTTTTLSADQINALLEAGGQSGLGKNLDELKQFVMDAAKVGVAFDMSAEQAGGTMATFRAALGLDQKGAMDLAAMVNTLSNKSDGKVTAAQIAEVLAREGASAKIAGFSMADSAALASAFVSAGMESEVASTALKKVSGALTKGYAATGGQREAMDKLGFDPEELASMMQVNASGTLIQVLETIHSSPPEEQSALISQLFGEEAVKGVSILSSNLKLFTNAQKNAKLSVDDHIKSLDQEYQAKLDTSAAGIELFKNRVARLAVIIGDALKPALDWTLGHLSTFVDYLGDVAKGSQTATTVVASIAGLAVAIPSAIIGFKMAKLFFGNVGDFFRLFGKGAGARKGLDNENRASGRVVSMLSRQWSKLNNVMRRNPGPNGNGGLGGEYRSRTRPRSRGRGRGFSGLVRRGMGAFNPKTAALSMGAGAVAMMPMNAMAADALDAGGDIADFAGKAGLARILKPLGIAMNGVSLAQGLADGNMEQAGEAAGDIGGSLGGAALGATIGTFILPGIGTAIGGLLGSIAGGIGGEMIGGWFGRKLDSPDEMAAKVNAVQAKEAEARQQPPVSFAPVITVNGANGQDETAIAQKVVEQMDQRYSYLMGGNTVSTRLGYAAIDQN